MSWVLIRIASLRRFDSNELRGDSYEYSQHMFSWRTKNNYPSIIIKYTPYLFHWLLKFAVDLKDHARRKDIFTYFLNAKDVNKYNKAVRWTKIFRHPTDCCNYLKIWTMWLCHRVMSPTDADRMANSIWSDCSSRRNLICVYTVFPGLSVRKFRIITVLNMKTVKQHFV